MKLEPYLIFPGTCREALEFYSKVFGGTVELIQTMSESPLPSAPEHADRIFNAVFAADELRLRASDGEPDKDPRVGENVSLFVTCPDAREQQRIFEALAEGGRIIFPLEGGFGMVEDRYRFWWMLAQPAG